MRHLVTFMLDSAQLFIDVLIEDDFVITA